MSQLFMLDSVSGSVLQENHLALRSEGVKMVVDSKRPHFVGIDPDAFSTGLVFYYLKVCGGVRV